MSRSYMKLSPERRNTPMLIDSPFAPSSPRTTLYYRRTASSRTKIRHTYASCSSWETSDRMEKRFMRGSRRSLDRWALDLNTAMQYQRIQPRVKEMQKITLMEIIFRILKTRSSVGILYRDITADVAAGELLLVQCTMQGKTPRR